MLRGVIEDLLSEDHPPTYGHRQITVSHEDGLTQTLVHFLLGSGLRNHQVNGIVTLPRGITFGVEAVEETELLMTVHLGRHV